MWEQIAANRRKSIVLVMMMGLLLGALGYFGGVALLGRDGGGNAGLVLALVVWLVMTATAWFQGDNIMLALSGAKKVGPGDLPMLHNIVEEMALAAGLPTMPDVYVIDDPAPNAFATGRRPEKSAVAVTSGLLKVLDRDELQGVMAHEIAHVRNRDVQLMLFAGVLAGAIVILSEIGMRGMWFGGMSRGRSRRDSGQDGSGIFAIIAIALMILAPILSQLIYFAVSRKREYLADASAASFTRYPEGLARALEKIAGDPRKLGNVTSATAPNYIINPLKRSGKMAANATSTHPPIDERVRILRSMGTGSFGAYEESYRQVTGRRGVIPGSALKGDGGQAGRPAPERPAAGPAPARKVRAREVEDFLYAKDGYRRIPCDCGTVLKLPPDFASPGAKCPRCGTVHKV